MVKLSPSSLRDYFQRQEHPAEGHEVLDLVLIQQLPYQVLP